MFNILLLQEIKNLFQRPPHEVDNYKANDLATRLIENGSYDERLRKIRDAVHFLYPLDQETDSLALWRLALKYECMLRDYLLDELNLLFHSRTTAELAREDMRYIQNHISIHRYNISSYNLGSYRKSASGKSALPKPPNNWRELLGIPDPVFKTAVPEKVVAPTSSFNPFVGHSASTASNDGMAPTTSTNFFAQATASTPRAMAGMFHRQKISRSDT